MVFYRTPNDRCEVGPDYLRLCFKFEVCKSVSEDNDDNVLMRAMSYAMMLGDIKPIHDLI